MAVVRVESEQFPYLPLRLTVDERTVEVMALIDTGFDGDLAVPVSLMSDDKPPDDYRTWALADGTEIEAAIYYGSVQVGNLAPLDCDVTVLGEEAIVGRGITDSYRVILDHGERVIVEP